MPQSKMANSHPLPSSVFCVLLLLLPILSSQPAFSESSLKHGFRVVLTHVDAGRNFTKFEILRRGIEREKTRIQNFNKMTIGNSDNIHDLQMPVVERNGSYLMNLSLGTPPVSFSAIVDTGSDLIWTQCKPCLECFEQPTPEYDPARSSSFANATCSAELCKALTNSSSSNDGCEYSYGYGDESSTEGYLAFETLTIGDANQQVSAPNIAFGCRLRNHVKDLKQDAGMVGLGRGPLSLLSQLDIHKFSYCLTPNGTGSLIFGSSSINNTTNQTIKFTPLIRNPFQPSFYYLSLQGITVGQKFLPIPSSWFKLSTDGSGGVIIDSGITITYLTEDAFDVLKPEFTAQTNLPVKHAAGFGLDLCFELPSHNKSKLDVPDLIFHFEGLDLNLPVENYMITDEEHGLVCLAMGAVGGLSIFGSMQHQNMLVLHDLQKEIVSFVPTQCALLGY